MAADLGVATGVMNIAVSITALFSGIFIVVVGGLADRVGRVKLLMWGREAFGDDAVVCPGPSYLGSEDFAFMLQKRKGTYCLLGNGDTAMVHRPQYVFDDAILPMGAACWVTLTERYLQ